MLKMVSFEITNAPNKVEENELFHCVLTATKRFIRFQCKSNLAEGRWIETQMLYT